MYQYSDKDKQIVKNRTKEFLSQVKRRIDGNLTEEEFKPLRLMNGLYLQLHAYMLRVAIPYGELSHIQLNKLAEISEKYDKGYGHFTTRQNIQFNWPKLEDVPKILNELAGVEMHAIQTSGNCIRNISCDHLAGINNEEVEDPRPWCEIIRKWSTFHPEFSYLPRKFKIAVIASETDRAAMKVHDIGLKLVKKRNQIGFEVYVGGGQGRSPFIAKKINNFVKKRDLLQTPAKICPKMANPDKNRGGRCQLAISNELFDSLRSNGLVEELPIKDFPHLWRPMYKIEDTVNNNSNSDYEPEEEDEELKALDNKEKDAILQDLLDRNFEEMTYNMPSNDNYLNQKLSQTQNSHENLFGKKKQKTKKKKTRKKRKKTKTKKKKK